MYTGHLESDKLPVPFMFKMGFMAYFFYRQHRPSERTRRVKQKTCISINTQYCVFVYQN